MTRPRIKTIRERLALWVAPWLGYDEAETRAVEADTDLHRRATSRLGTNGAYVSATSLGLLEDE